MTRQFQGSRQRVPQGQLQVVTAYPSAKLEVGAMKLGADYLIEPVAPDNLEKPIQETLLKKAKVDIRRAKT